MASLYQLRRRVRQLVDEVDNSYGESFPDATIHETAQAVIAVFAEKTEILEGIWAIPLVEGRTEYRLPSDFLKLDIVGSGPSVGENIWTELSDAEYDSIVKNGAPGKTLYYNIVRGRIRIWPPPAAPVTDRVDGDITAGTPNFPVGDGNENKFSAYGFVRILNETIQYENRVGQIFGIRSREESQTRGPVPPAVIADLSVVTLCGLVMKYKRSGAEFYRPDDVVIDDVATQEGAIIAPGETRVVIENTDHLGEIFRGDYIGFGIAPAKFYLVETVTVDDYGGPTETWIDIAEPYKGPAAAELEFVASASIFGDDPQARSFLETVAQATAAELLRGKDEGSAANALEAKYQEGANQAIIRRGRKAATNQQVGDSEAWDDRPMW